MHRAATSRSVMFQQLYTLVAAFHAEYALTADERSELFGLTMPAVVPAARKPTRKATPAAVTVTAPIDLARLPDDERRAYYTRTAPYFDVQFMLTVGRLSPALRADVETLAAKVDASGRFAGITRSEFYRQYDKLRTRKRAEADAADWSPAGRLTLTLKADAWRKARAADLDWIETTTAVLADVARVYGS